MLIKRKKFVLYVFAFLCLSNCHPKNESNQWHIVEISSSISRDSIYRELDKRPEIFSVFENQDSLMKRTSDVAYFNGTKQAGEIKEYSRFNNCRAYISDADILFIKIGIGNGFGGEGFNITYTKSKFYTEPYFVTDVIMPGDADPVYDIIFQKLILNKPNYFIGDSLYGYIDFESIETDKDNNKTVHFGKGFFRAIVIKE